MELNLRRELRRFAHTLFGVPLLGGVRAFRRAGAELVSCWVYGFWNAFIPSAVVPESIRRAAYRRHRGLTMARSTRIEPGCFFSHDCAVTLAEGCIVRRKVQFLGPEPIRIGAGCGIGPETMLTTETREISPRAGPAVGEVFRGITVGAGSWIGARVTVLAGVVIGEGCIISPGAVVSEDCAPNGMYGGVPARRICDLA